jgi:uncharacterized Zn finger protein
MGNKRSINDISTDSDSDNNDNYGSNDNNGGSDDDGSDDGDKTPTNNDSGGDVTPNETLNDITDMKNTLKKVEEALSGKENKQDIDNIKKEFSSYFDEDSGNTTQEESLNQIKEYLVDEIKILTDSTSLAGLGSELDKLTIRSDTKSHEEPVVSANKKVETNEGSASTIDFVLEKQSMDPLDPTDDQD